MASLAPIPFSPAELLQAGLAARDMSNQLRVLWLEALDPATAQAVVKRMDKVLLELPTLGAVVQGDFNDLAELTRDIGSLRRICKKCCDNIEDYDNWLASPEGVKERAGVLQRIHKQCRQFRIAVGHRLARLQPVVPQPPPGAAARATSPEISAPPPTSEASTSTSSPQASSSKKKKKPSKKGKGKGKGGEPATTSGSMSAAISTNATVAERSLPHVPVAAKCPHNPCVWCTATPSQRPALDAALDMYNACGMMRRDPSEPFIAALRATKEAMDSVMPSPAGWLEDDVFEHCDLFFALYAEVSRTLAASLKALAYKTGEAPPPELLSLMIAWPEQTSGLSAAQQQRLDTIIEQLDALGLVPQDVDGALQVWVQSLSLLMEGDLSGDPEVRQAFLESSLSLSLAYQGTQELAMCHGLLGDAVRLSLAEEIATRHRFGLVENIKNLHHHRRQLDHYQSLTCWTFEEALDHAGTAFLILLPRYLEARARPPPSGRPPLPGSSNADLASAEQERATGLLTDAIVRMASLLQPYAFEAQQALWDSQSSVWTLYDTYRLSKYLLPFPHPDEAPPLPCSALRSLRESFTSLLDQNADHEGDLSPAQILALQVRNVALARAVSAATGDYNGVNAAIVNLDMALERGEELLTQQHRLKKLETARRQAAASKSSRWVDTTTSKLPPASAIASALAEVKAVRQALQNSPEELGWPPYAVTPELFGMEKYISADRLRELQTLRVAEIEIVARAQAREATDPYKYFGRVLDQFRMSVEEVWTALEDRVEAIQDSLKLATNPSPEYDALQEALKEVKADRKELIRRGRLHRRELGEEAPDKLNPADAVFPFQYFVPEGWPGALSYGSPEMELF